MTHRYLEPISRLMTRLRTMRAVKDLNGTSVALKIMAALLIIWNTWQKRTLNLLRVLSFKYN